MINKEICKLRNRECDSIRACEYMQHRFGVLDCERQQHLKEIKDIHNKELEERKKVNINYDYKEFLDTRKDNKNGESNK